MSTKIALAGNPNCGKTTMFNSLTGTVQYVGNWPGVTVEKKEGKVKGKKDLIVTDLPGIYSLSPYTSEEVVSRNYLASDEADAVINIVDATNLERNLYLTTQILELGKPVVVALNMVDSLKKSGDKIDVKKLSEKLGCKVIETVALHGKGLKEVAAEAEKLAESKAAESKKSEVADLKETEDLKNAEGKEKTKVPSIPSSACFAEDVENSIREVEKLLPSSVAETAKRWTAIKVLERDNVILENLDLGGEAKSKAEEITVSLEKKHDDDIESIITNERYNYINSILKGVLTKSGKTMTVSDKIDRVVTNRILGIPIFLLVMWFVYWVSVSTVGTMGTDWANDVLFGEWIQGGTQAFLENAGANPVLTDCIVNGILGGLGAVLGFIPQMAILFLLLSILEDCGYMVRIAFVMDRVFRKFGLSGKSFIPLLISSGCGIPGIMAARTIENENDRRMTIMTTTWIPCGAKLPVIAMVAAILATKFTNSNASWLAPTMYAIGIASVLVAAIILKKTKYFHGPASPFIMELPQYHIPQAKTVLLHTWERLWSFIKKAGTILFLACLVMWFLSSYGWQKKTAESVNVSENIERAENGMFIEPAESMKSTETIEKSSERSEFGAEAIEKSAGTETVDSMNIDETEVKTKTKFGLVEDADDSIMAKIGNGIRYIFIPLGFGGENGGWQCAASVLSGFSAKEGIVATMGVLSGASSEDTESLAEAGSVEDVEKSNSALDAISKWFPTGLAAFCFLLFNLLDSPCLAAIATMAGELKNRKWFWFAIVFQNAFAYVVTLIVYQLGTLFTQGQFGAGTVFGFVFLAAILFGLFRKNPYSQIDAKRK